MAARTFGSAVWLARKWARIFDEPYHVMQTKFGWEVDRFGPMPGRAYMEHYVVYPRNQASTGRVVNG